MQIYRIYQSIANIFQESFMVCHLLEERKATRLQGGCIQIMPLGILICTRIYSDLILLHLVLIGFDFIREAMKSAAITNEALAQKLNVIRNTVQLGFKKDDITISNIYKIAEGYGWEVNITFKLKQQGE